METINRGLGVGQLTRLISGPNGLKIGATSGQKTIAQATDVFLGGIDPHFQHQDFNVSSEPRGEILVDIRGVFRNGTFAQIFGDINPESDHLKLTQEQIISCAKNYQAHLRGYLTLFLFKGKSGLFVAFVGFSHKNENHSIIGVDRFCFPYKKFKDELHCQVVVPKMFSRPTSKASTTPTAEMPSYRP